MTDEKMRELVKECGLDWQRGYMPLFDGDPTNRYAVLIEAAIAAEHSTSLPAPPAACCVCGSTAGVTKDGWYGYRCGSVECMVF